ncbi:hypothetical protein GUITHDRAFT_136393 [Guillardia theta CCMP2712]|uniref:Mitochondrial carrier protein n=1 Tax=Guillardia theta (strain CCMP2712) TaxID=905079 RepID=L1JJJ1_GUITC|nr:hypothetical protein GUITHDRAFT_136393 [Guillardia theta CCMP2712]EKX48698.1 hypothetical protein GUITHDRAFT_136393 [Guillardia theta CCMP2712]|eukprot:XP_005835678.1 hypothetical protein GUITHDRAFT_136393 [Guillardia theta CCMP2712]
MDRVYTRYRAVCFVRGRLLQVCIASWFMCCRMELVSMRAWLLLSLSALLWQTGCSFQVHTLSRMSRPLPPRMQPTSKKGSGKLCMQDQGGDRPRGPSETSRERPETLKMSRRNMLLLGLGASMVLGSKEANAAFGPAGSAAISQPPIKNLSLEDFLELSLKKQKQRQKSLYDKQIDTMLKEIREEEARNYKSLEEFEDLVQRAKEDAKYRELQERLLQRMREEEQRDELERQLLQRQQLLQRLDEQPAWVSYTAAFLASVFSTAVMHPIDTIKIRLMSSHQDDLPPPHQYPDNQSGDSGVLENLTTSSDEVPQQHAHGHGHGQVMVEEREFSRVGTMLLEKADHGWEGSHDMQLSLEKQDRNNIIKNAVSLYDGVLPNMMKEAPSSALYLGIYEAVRSQLNLTPLSQYPLAVYLLSGAVGELIGSVIRAPSEAVKTRVQTGISTGEAIKIVAGEEGRRNTFRAWQSSILRDVPMGGLQIAIFEGLKTFIINSPDIDFDVNTIQCLRQEQAEALLGALGGAIGAFLTTPSDIITTLIITKSESLSGEELENVNIASVSKEILSESGPLGFFKGSFQRTIYWAPAIGIFLSGGKMQM